MFTNATLTQAIQDWTENSEASFIAQIPMFIRLAEERILKATQLQVFQDTQKDTVLTGTRTVPKPCDWLATYSLGVSAILVSGSRITLQNKDKTFLDSYWPDYSLNATPKYYADHSVTLFALAPTPDVDYDVIISYLRRPQSLADTSGDVQTWISTNAPQTLLYASLVEAYTYLKGNQDMIQAYMQRFGESIVRLKNHGEALEPDDSYKKSIIRGQVT